MDDSDTEKFINNSNIKFFYEVHCCSCDYINRQLILNRECPVCGDKMKYWKKIKDSMSGFKRSKATWINGDTEIYS